MLKVDPVKRLSASEALLNTWVLGTCSSDKMLVPLTDSHETLKKKLHDRERREREKLARQAANKDK